MMEMTNACRILHIKRSGNHGSLERTRIMAPVQRDASFRSTVYCTVQSGYCAEQGYACVMILDSDLIRYKRRSTALSVKEVISNKSINL